MTRGPVVARSNISNFFIISPFGHSSEALSGAGAAFSGEFRWGTRSSTLIFRLVPVPTGPFNLAPSWKQDVEIVPGFSAAEANRVGG